MMQKTCNFVVVVQPAEIVDSGTMNDELAWTLDDAGTLAIQGEGTMSGDSPFIGDTRIRHIILKYGIKNISDTTFSGCSNLESIEIADSVETIGTEAFCNCTSLFYIVFPESVTMIGERAFFGCDILCSAVISRQYGLKLGDMALGYQSNGQKIKDFRIYANDSTYASIYAHDNDFSFFPITEKIKSAGSFGESVDWLYDEDDTLALYGSGATYNFDTSANLSPFYGNQDIKRIVIKEGITKIGNMAFEGCSNLKRVEFADSLEAINFRAFFRCGKLDHI